MLKSIAYGGFYGGNEVTCYDADCIEDALEEKSPLIIHLGQDIDLGDARYKINHSHPPRRGPSTLAPAPSRTE